MAYQPLGLGALILSALRAAVDDPAMAQRQTETANALGELTTRVGLLASQLTSDEAGESANAKLTADQSETLTGVQNDLRGLADALAGGILTQVQPVKPADPAAAPAPAADAGTGVGGAGGSTTAGPSEGAGGSSTADSGATAAPAPAPAADAAPAPAPAADPAAAAPATPAADTSTSSTTGTDAGAGASAGASTDTGTGTGAPSGDTPVA